MRRWLVVKHWVGNREKGYWVGPHVVSTFDYERFNWWLGPQYFTATPGEGLEIVERYTEFDGAGSDQLDAIERRFVRDYPEEPAPLAWGIGWLAPDGTFYPCHNQEHFTIAGRLWYMHHDEGECPFRPDGVLEDEGWLKLYYSGQVTGSVQTPAQLDALRALAELAPDEDKRRMIEWMIEAGMEELRYATTDQP